MFGSRLVSGLVAHTGFVIVVAGRDKRRLDALVARHAAAGPGRLVPCVLDVRTLTPDQVRATGCFVLVDAAGPFQGGGFGSVHAAIAAGVHYLDLADARQFVAGFPALGPAACREGVVALTGASSTPALSNAAMDRLTAGWRQVDRVEIAISPGNRAPRGLSVMQAILSYAGQTMRVFDGGEWRPAPGWGMTVRRTMPGLGPRILSVVDAPDLDIIPGRFAVRRSALFRAGLELPVLHLGLWALSLLVRLRAVHTLRPAARMLRAAAALFESFGTDRGGMTVDSWGVDAAGKAVRGTWSLVAEGGDGPFIPTLPALAAIRALADGRIAAPGASACVGVLSLDEIEAEFRPYRIASRIEFEAAPPSLYAGVLGRQFAQMPLSIQAIHQPGWGLCAYGSAHVDGPEGWAAAAVASVFGFPPVGEMPVSIEITRIGQGERWVRDFGGRRFTSRLSASPVPGRLIERFGPFAFELDLPTSRAGVLGMPVLAWWLGGMPMPRALAPVSIATEDLDEEGRFRFDVELRLPFRLGRLVRYRGWLDLGACPAEVKPGTRQSSSEDSMLPAQAEEARHVRP